MAAISKAFLELLLCPEDRSPLHEADAALLARLNQAVAAQRLKNRGGQAISKPLDAGLVRADGAMLYPIVDGIPIMLIDEAIPLDQVPSAEARA